MKHPPHHRGVYRSKPMMFAVLIAALVAAGPSPGELTPWVAGGSATALLFVVFGLNTRQIINLIRENRVCKRQLGIAFRVLRENKLSVPPEFFDEVEEVANEPLPKVDGRGWFIGRR